MGEKPHKITAIQGQLPSLFMYFLCSTGKNIRLFTLKTYFIFCYSRVQKEEILFL